MSAEKTATCKVSATIGSGATTEGISEAEAKRGQPPARYQRPDGSGATTGGISEVEAERGQPPARHQRPSEAVHHRRYK